MKAYTVSYYRYDHYAITCATGLAAVKRLTDSKGSEHKRRRTNAGKMPIGSLVFFYNSAKDENGNGANPKEVHGIVGIGISTSKPDLDDKCGEYLWKITNPGVDWELPFKVTMLSSLDDGKVGKVLTKFKLEVLLGRKVNMHGLNIQPAYLFCPITKLTESEIEKIVSYFLD